MSTRPEPYSERVRLASIIGDARKLLDEPPADKWASRCGKLEAMLRMLADSAEIVASQEAGGLSHGA